MSLDHKPTEYTTSTPTSITTAHNQQYKCVCVFAIVRSASQTDKIVNPQINVYVELRAYRATLQLDTPLV